MAKKKIYELDAHSSIADTDVVAISATASGDAEKSTASELKTYVKTGLTTADVAASTDKNYVTDAQATVIGNTSGTNTGDQDLSGLASKTNVLEKDNTTSFTPTADYHPATKKYVDDNSGGGTGDVTASGTLTDNAILLGGGTTVAKTSSKTIVTTLGADDTTVPTSGAVAAAISSAGGGDVTGPASSVDSNVVMFNGITGKLLKDSGVSLSGSNTGDETTATIKTKLGAATTSTDGYLTSTDRNTFNGKQASLGYTAEDSANKETSALDTSTTKYPCNNVVKSAVDAKFTNSMATGKLLGRGSASTGVVEEITLGTNLSLSGTTLNATGGSGGSYWTAVPGSPTRTADTTFTVTDTGNAELYNELLQRGTCLKWEESGTVKQAMIHSATYASDVVTVTIFGDTMASIDSGTLKYGMEKARMYKFAVAGAIGTTGTNVTNTILVEMPVKVFGCDLYAGTAGDGTTTIDINKNGTTMFTTKPSITSTSQYILGVRADSGTTASTGNLLTLDQDAVAATTAIVDEYVNLYYTPLYNINLA